MQQPTAENLVGVLVITQIRQFVQFMIVVMWFLPVVVVPTILELARIILRGV